jgi:aflatoxin B1 aldehyde reductase
VTGVSKLHAPASLRAVFDESLKALNTENVDIFYLHAADRQVPFVQTLREVNELYKEGKFRILGLSNFSAFEVAEVATICREKGWVRPTLYQALYNLFNREIEKELVPALRRYGIDLVCYSPLAGGLLSGRYKDMNEKPGEGRFDAEGGYELMAEWFKFRYWHEAQFQALRILEEAADKEGCSMVELAMRWLVHHSKLRMRSEGGNDGIIVGVGKLEQVESNVKAFEGGPLSPKTVEAIDRAWFTVAKERKEASFWIGELEYGYDTAREENWK